MAYYSNPQFLTSINQGGPLVRQYKEANSQTFKAGQPVYLNSSGDSLTAVASDGQVLLGFAKEDATNVTSGNAFITVEVVRPGDEYEIDVYTGGATDAATTAMLGQNFAFDVTSNSAKIDLNDTGHDVMTLQRILNDDATKVAVTFLASCLQYNVGY